LVQADSLDEPPDIISFQHDGSSPHLPPGGAGPHRREIGNAAA
jgi:hypothetical protein